MPVVLAHNFTANGTRTDAEVCRDLYGWIAAHRECALFVEQRDPAALKGFLFLAEAVITARFHAMVGAVSSGVPSFEIGWNHK